MKFFLNKKFLVIGLKRSSSKDYRILNLKNNNLILYDIDLIDLENIFKTHEIDVVINTVCSYGRKEENQKFLEDSNFNFPKLLLKCSKDNCVKLFLNTDTLLPDKINDYSFTKSKFRRCLKDDKSAIKIINLRIEHMYGPLDDDNKFVNWLINEILTNSEIIKLTSGVQLRDFIYIDDVVSAFDYCVMNSHKFVDSYNEYDLISGKLTSVKEFVCLIVEKLSIIKKLDFSKRVLFGELSYRPNEVMTPKFNHNSLIDTSWNPKVFLNEGLNQILKNYK